MLLRLLTAACLVGVANGLFFHIKQGEVKCFVEEVPDETMVSGKPTEGHYHTPFFPTPYFSVPPFHTVAMHSATVDVVGFAYTNINVCNMPLLLQTTRTARLPRT